MNFRILLKPVCWIIGHQYRYVKYLGYDGHHTKCIRCNENQYGGGKWFRRQRIDLVDMKELAPGSKDIK